MNNDTAAIPSAHRHVLITGASGGLGQCLARDYAKSGMRLTLWGRDALRLDAVAATCAQQGAQIHLEKCDIRDYAAVRDSILHIDQAHPIDLAILNAGVSSGSHPQTGAMESAADACRVMQVNAAGTLNMAASLLECMVARKRGHLVFISSLAALYPLPDSPAYSASKIAMASYAQAMKLALAHTKIRISIVYPGYVLTPMSERLKGPQPLRLGAEEAATLIRSRLEAGCDSIAFPQTLALGMRLLHFLPATLAAFFLRRFAFTVEPDAESTQKIS